MTFTPADSACNSAKAPPIGRASATWTPATAQATCRRVQGMIADEALPRAGYHIAFPALGRINSDGARFRVHPAGWLGLVA